MDHSTVPSAHGGHSAPAQPLSLMPVTHPWMSHRPLRLNTGSAERNGRDQPTHTPGAALWISQGFQLLSAKAKVSLDSASSPMPSNHTRGEREGEQRHSRQKEPDLAKGTGHRACRRARGRSCVPGLFITFSCYLFTSPSFPLQLHRSHSHREEGSHRILRFASPFPDREVGKPDRGQIPWPCL